MKNLIILVLALASAFALPSKEIKSRNLVVPAGRPEGRVTRGHAADKGKFPYQVGLTLTWSDLKRYTCGGSLLNNKWVLTAAHCTYDAIAAEVLLGATDRESPEVRHFVYTSHIINHARYNDDTQENDIALIEIPFTEYSDYIQPVKLPAKARSYSSYAGDNVIASGWGRTSDSPLSNSRILQWAQLTIIPNKVCRKRFIINDQNICTATVGGVNICNGDSGGPIVLESNQVQIGVTSFGAKSCLKDVPSVYTRVTSYLGWIEEISGVSS